MCASRHQCIKITPDRAAQTISLSQTAYIESIINRFNLADAKSVAMPMIPGAVYSKQDNSPSDPVEAARMKSVLLVLARPRIFRHECLPSTLVATQSTLSHPQTSRPAHRTPNPHGRRPTDRPHHFGQHPKLKGPPFHVARTARCFSPTAPRSGPRSCSGRIDTVFNIAHWQGQFRTF